MIPFISLPIKVVRLFTSNVSPDEIASGICLGMFMGFVPLNGPITILLLICFFVFKINRLSAMLVLPLFKLFYVLGVWIITDAVGGVLLIKADFLYPVWSALTHMPVLALLNLNNTLVTGGLVLSGVLSVPVFILSKKSIVFLREKYGVKMKNSIIVKGFLKVPIVDKIVSAMNKIKGEE